MFITPESQLELVLKLNQEHLWDFTGKDFDKLGQPPALPTGLRLRTALTAIVLEVCFDLIWQNFLEPWNLLVAAQDGHILRSDQIKFDADHLRLLPGIKQQRGLRWRVVDLAANWDRKDGIRPMDVRNSQTSPHAAILWAAFFFSEWLAAMDGLNVPCVWIPGCQVNVRRQPSWSIVPRLGFTRGSSRLALDAESCISRGYRWAVPEFRKPEARSR